MKYAVGCLVMILAMGSCVTNKKLQYLQKDDVKADNVPLDTVIRSYVNPDFQYRIQPYDVLSIRIESLTGEEYDFFSSSMMTDATGAVSAANAALSGELVNENGEIEFPVVGKIQVAGLTIDALQIKVRNIAQKYLDDPVVKIRLLNFRFTLLGEVDQEGTVSSFNHRLSLMEAIGLAGGLTDLADRSKIKIIRQVDNKTEVMYANVLAETFVTSPYYYVHQNDVIVVPSLRQRPFRTYFGQNLGLFLSSISTVLLVINLFTR